MFIDGKKTEDLLAFLEEEHFRFKRDYETVAGEDEVDLGADLAIEVAVPRSPLVEQMEKDFRRFFETCMEVRGPTVRSLPLAARSWWTRTRSSMPGPTLVGKGIVRREGKDITIVSNSQFLKRTLAEANKTAEEGIDAEVIDPLTEKRTAENPPLTRDSVRSRIPRVQVFSVKVGHSDADGKVSGSYRHIHSYTRHPVLGYRAFYGWPGTAWGHCV